MEVPEEKKRESDGIAVALSLLLFGALCPLAPAYFDAEGGTARAWYIAGIAIGFIGALGLVTELAGEKGKKGIGDLGFGVACLLLALATGVIARSWSPPSPLTGALKGVAVFFVFFGVYGVVTGLRQGVKRRREASQRPVTSTEKVFATLAGLAGLATAGVNLFAAMRSQKGP